MTQMDAHVRSHIALLEARYGAVPPPWVVFPQTHPYSIGWRMGAGESHLMAFDAWWATRKTQLGEEGRLQYFRQWPPPARWLTWMFDVIWDLQPWEVGEPEDFDYTPYFARAQALGFGTRADYERDMADPQWE